MAWMRRSCSAAEATYDRTRGPATKYCDFHAKLYRASSSFSCRALDVLHSLGKVVHADSSCIQGHNRDMAPPSLNLQVQQATVSSLVRVYNSGSSPL